MTYVLKDKLPSTLLRFSTAGSVDDGKSTFIGRLLFDTGNIYDDHVAALRAKADLAGDKKLPLALVTDGLRAEREQGITIDVAYRYFSSTKRRFILADSPGHEQYTRNMATAASTADLTVVLVDAKAGILPQTKRHAFVAALLGVPRLLIAINKMDLVDFSEDRFNELRQEFTDFSSKLGVKEVKFVPIVAVDGDNIVNRSSKMSWYKGETVLDYLESVYIAADSNQIDFRLPVQWVVRHLDQFRGFAGTVESGSIRVGEELVALPSKLGAVVTAIQIPSSKNLGESVEECQTGDAVVISLSKEIDIARGSMLVRANNVPKITQEFQAMLVWCSETEAQAGAKLIVRHTSSEVKAQISVISYLVDVHNLHRKTGEILKLNDIARVTITTQEPLFLDAYQKNRATGSFILIDPITNQTLAAGLVVEREILEAALVSNNLHEVKSLVPEISNNAKTFWMTGLSGSGKTTIAQALELKVFELGKKIIRLDGDSLRQGLNSDLGFSSADRLENIRRAAEVAKILNQSGINVICSLISPLEEHRELAKKILGLGYLEVYVKADLAVCEARDPNGLYKRARAGEIKDFTGVGAEYQEPSRADLVLDTGVSSVGELVGRLLGVLGLKMH